MAAGPLTLKPTARPDIESALGRSSSHFLRWAGTLHDGDHRARLPPVTDVLVVIAVVGAVTSGALAADDPAPGPRIIQCYSDEQRTVLHHADTPKPPEP